MSPQRIANAVRREVPLLREDARLRDAIRQLAEADVPALPVVDAQGALLGVFGEHEFIGALFPGYLKTLGHARFVPRSLDHALEKRATCGDDPVAKYMHTDHVNVAEDVSDTELAEIFLHHSVLVIPVVVTERVAGVVTREDFSRTLAEHLLSPPP